MKTGHEAREPWAVANMEELFAIARDMEGEAIEGYVALAERMRNEGRPDLADVFDTLRLEEQGHLQNVDNWIGRSSVRTIPVAAMAVPMFDDEGAGIVAPELLDSYRAFSMAVRNEERAFVFWTYVAAHAPDDAVRRAAEQMAREELGHVATLRKARRRAFHDLRRTGEVRAPADIAALERQLSAMLEEEAKRLEGSEAERWLELSSDAQTRSASAMTGGLAGKRPDEPGPAVTSRLVTLCEFLLDIYLALAEQQSDETHQVRAQRFAGELLECLHVVRAA